LIKDQAVHFNQPTRSGGAILSCRIRHKGGQFYVAVDTPVYNWFTEGFDTKVLKEAKALLDELSV
jgi:hypothetical protein